MAPGPEYSLPIESFYNGDTFLLNGVEVEDYYPALCRAQGLKPLSPEADMWSHPLGTYDPSKGIHQLALRLVFQAKLYCFSHTIEIVRQIHLLGVLSGNGSFNATRFKFPPNTGGLILHTGSSGHLRSHVIPGDIINDIVSSTFTEGKVVDRDRLGSGMAEYCGWKIEDYFPEPATPSTNDAQSIHSAGSIIENLFFEGSNDALVRLDRPDLGRDTFPDFKLLVSTDDQLANDRRSVGTKLLNPYETSGALTPGDVIKKMNGQTYDSWNEASKAAHGLLLFGVSEVRSCTISKFSGHGIYIFGNNFQGNDLTLLSRVTIESNNGDGLHIFGSDAGLITGISISSAHNAGWGAVSISQSSAVTFISCNWSYNQKGGFLTPYQLYAPVFDVQAVDERSSTDLTDDKPAPVSIPLPQKNLQSLTTDFLLTAGGVVMIGCYSESNWSDPSKRNIATENFLNFGSLLFGCTMGGVIDGHPQNLHTFSDNSLINEGAFTGLGNRGSMVADAENTIPYSYTAATLGSNVYHNVGLSVSQRFSSTLDNASIDQGNSDATELLLQHREVSRPDPLNPEKLITEPTHYWGFCTVNSLAQSPLSISHRHNQDIGDGQLWLEKGFFIGPTQDPYYRNDPRKRVRVLVSTEADFDSTISSLGRQEGSSLPGKGSPDLYQWEEGDIILNKKPTPGGNVGWICCRDSAGQLRWFKYGSIDVIPES
ncbi:MAG: right-handed parallel beta-helix repeat-containing protein [Nitrospira sp.]|nr:right-handed parallel beta-helix repeat-containing protein [Nitrospira sp.]